MGAHDSGIEVGRCYWHYKGTLYKVVGMARHSETLDQLVLYQKADDQKGDIWARPATMWFDPIGQTQTRRFEPA